MSEVRVSEGRVRVAEMAPRGMVTIRADLSADGDRVAEATGMAVPGPLGWSAAGEEALLWFSPDELVLVCPRESAAARAGEIAAALGDRHALVEDMSDARVTFTLDGADLRETLAKLTPADMGPAAFRPGMLRRTRIAEIAAGLRLLSETRAEVFVFRSVAGHAFEILTRAAAPGGRIGLY